MNLFILYVLQFLQEYRAACKHCAEYDINLKIPKDCLLDTLNQECPTSCHSVIHT